MGTEGKAYRLFYSAKAGFMRHREEVIYGEAELERRLNLQRPRVIHHEVALLFRCGICKVRGPWTRTWRSMPQRGPTLVTPDWTKPHVLTCSDECAEAHWPGRAGKAYGSSDNEPVNYTRQRGNQARLKARWAAFALERERLAQLREHRKVPMFHEGKPEGWCRWCGEPVLKPRRTWHEECFRTYNLHSNAEAQAYHLRRRDGRACKVEGCQQDGTDVDHMTPLWRVRHLPDLERLPYYGPDNLQLLCAEHHKEKTAREAGERARERVGKADG